ncbi:MAG: M28 family peptidase [Deltaproteobacteria bacterium]|nr:M28 family peptidase [Deltaproteobacteria bacterium]
MRFFLGLLGVVALAFAGRWLLCAPIEPGALRPPPASLGEGADPERLEREVRFLAETIGARGHRHPDAMRKAADHLAAMLEGFGATVERQPTPVGAPPFENVRARFGAGEPSRVVGAHYDSWLDTAGADDNASGVAGLLELARLLGSLEDPPSVELVAYANEEPPHFRTRQMGSVAHALVTPAGAEVVVLEMIGYYDDAPGSQAYPGNALASRMPDTGDFILVLGRTEDEALAMAVRDAMSIHSLPVYGYAAPPTVAGVDFSDHRSYWRHELPAVMVTDTAFLRNRAYHTSEDTPDRLDYGRMAMVVDGVFAWLVGE